MTKTNRRKNKILFFSIVFLFSGLLTFYFFQIVKMSEIAYEMGIKNDMINETKEEIIDLNLSVSKQKNLKNAEQKVIEQGFQRVSINTRSYIVVPEISLANK
ncbi:MAG: hypothetical protein PHU17_02060 [Candidatus Pacebacteria bacterium]|nr:hypothetical protein [Candidatus Paceibacterota bacterium]MDD4074286.1 hypothetical protein [Candidatus Paceibacterota bacterium]